MAMTNAKTVSNFFIEIANKDEYGDGITNLRVNKLLYLAQGHYFARSGQQLFEDDFEAWKYGPVIPSIYQRYRDYGRNPISEVDQDYNFEAFTPAELEVLLDVIRVYGKYSTSALVDFTHCADSPWAQSYGSSNQTISKESIESYFNTLDELETFDDILYALNLPMHDKRDAEGYVLLPYSDDDCETEHMNAI